MDETLQNGVRYDARHAAAYSAKIRALIPGYELLHQLSTELLLATLPASAHVLVAGSGTGEELLRYAAAAPGWQLSGIEPSADMNALAQARCEEAGLLDRVQLLPGKVGEQPLAATSFDAATSLLVLHFLPDDGSKAAYLQTLAAALRPDGVLLLADLGGERGEASFEQLFEAWYQQQCRSQARRDRVELDFAHLRQHVYPLSAARRTELLQQAGLVPGPEYWRAFGLAALLARKA